MLVHSFACTNIVLWAFLFCFKLILMNYKSYPDWFWEFSKSRKIKSIKKWISKIFINQCPKCGIGHIKYIGDDYISRVWISVYKCNKCNSEFI